MCTFTTQNMAKTSHSVTIYMKHKEPSGIADLSLGSPLETLPWLLAACRCHQAPLLCSLTEVKEIWIQEQKLAFTIHFHVAYVTILYTKKCNQEEPWYSQYAKI